jgi:hypothetical protein
VLSSTLNEKITRKSSGDGGGLANSIQREIFDNRKLDVETKKY